jgi:hypothetical protein
MLIIKTALILLVAAAGCNLPTSMNAESKNHESLDPRKLNPSRTLSKDVIVFIGRGGCCYGHIISIDKGGNLQYSVGTYSIAAANRHVVHAYLPETFEPNRIEVDKRYAQKNKNISSDVLERLAELLRDEQKLRFRDKSLVEDAYIYNIYLDNKEIAHGYDSKIETYPTNLREFITLVIGQVELHKLPGMA